MKKIFIVGALSVILIGILSAVLIRKGPSIAKVCSAPNVDHATCGECRSEHG